MLVFFALDAYEHDVSRSNRLVVTQTLQWRNSQPAATVNGDRSDKVSSVRQSNNLSNGGIAKIRSFRRGCSNLGVLPSPPVLHNRADVGSLCTWAMLTFRQDRRTGTKDEQAIPCCLPMPSSKSRELTGAPNKKNSRNRGDDYHLA